MPMDPLTSYEQAEAEADERFYEEREDAEDDLADEISDSEDHEPEWQNPREKGDDDGVEYGDPRDEREDRWRD